VQRHPHIATLAGGCLLVAACGSGSSASGDATVVATTAVMGDVVENLVGDLATVEVLMPRDADPHEFQPSARQAVTISEADLLVTNGGGLEAGLEDAVDAAAADGVPVFEALDHVETLVAGDSADSADSEADHAEDDGHGHDVDPHFSTDVVRMATAAEALADTLAAEVPTLDTDEFREQADAYVSELTLLDREVDATIAAVPDEQRKLVTDHLVFSYFADRFGFEIVGSILPSTTTEAAPSARDLDDLATAVSDIGVSAIFVEARSDDSLARTVADQAGGVEVVELHGETLGEPGSGADTYVGMIRTNATRIADALAV
jgi:zinc/manganese transport system substrate-binding protein